MASTTRDDEAPQSKLLSLFRDHTDHLPYLYEQQHEWVRHYNSLIWGIAAILIPFAFGGLAINYRDNSGIVDKAHLFSVAIGSVLLLAFWWLLSQWHRQLWKRNFFIANMIEVIGGYRPNNCLLTHAKGSTAPHLLPELAPSIDWGMWLRHGVVIVGFLVWILRVILDTWY